MRRDGEDFGNADRRYPLRRPKYLVTKGRSAELRWS
jgi:hypothetical protein